MKALTKGKFFLLFILLIQLVLVLLINTKYIFTLDNIIKLSQSYGLYETRFQNEDIYYSGKEIDPNYKYAPFKRGDTLKIIKIDDHFLGPFPVAFSFLSALFLFLLPPIFLPLISAISTVSTFYVLDRYWKTSVKVNLFLFFCTPIIFLSLDYAEYTLFMFLNFWGLTLLIYNENSKLKLISAAFLMGLSVWFRLESMLFVFALGISYLIVYRKNNEMLRQFVLPIFFYVVVIVVFFVFNYIDYGNILGTRFIANEAGFFQSGIVKKLENAIALLFLGKEFKIGLFLYLPVFLFVLIYLFKHFADLQDNYRILLITTLIFILFIALTTPNDGGHLNWGLRYFILGFMPLGILFDQLIKIKNYNNTKKIYSILVILLVIWSAMVTSIQLILLKTITKTLKTVQEQYNKSETDIWIFSDKGYVLNSGLEILRKKIFVVNTKTEANSLANLLKSNYKSVKIAYFLSNPKFQKMNPKKNSMQKEKEILSSLQANLVSQESIETKFFQIEIFSIE